MVRPRFILAILASTAALARADLSPLVVPSNAPAMSHAKTVRVQTLDKVDDANADGGSANLVARKGNDWFTLTAGKDPELKKFATIPDSDDSRIAGGVRVGKRRWVYVQCGKRRSFALDAESGLIVDFAIPGVEPPGRLGTQIQGIGLVLGVPAATFMLSGGERWPRGGNWPIYYWMNLNTGKFEVLPVGWDMAAMSPDQKIWFSLTGNRLDMTTGKPTEANPAETNGPEGTRIFNVDGKTYHLKQPYNGDLARAASDGQWVAFGGGQADMQAENNLSILSLKTLDPPEVIAQGIMDHIMLGNGNVLMLQRPKTRPDHGLLCEALVYQAGDKRTWNLLEDLPDLPPMPAEFIGTDYIHDGRTIQFIRSGDAPGPTLCVVHRDRHDNRAGGGVLLKLQQQRFVILVTPGHRYLTDLFQEGNVPECWLDPQADTVIVRQPTGELQILHLQLNPNEATPPAVPIP